MAEHTVVIATGNTHKVEEIAAIFGPVLNNTRFVSLKEMGDFPEPIEDGVTFFDNAYRKALHGVECTGHTCIADDSGLIVDALDGRPGVMSARWAGTAGDDAANNAKLLHELRDVDAKNRTARFYSCVVIVQQNGAWLSGEGSCEGHIGFAQKGAHGFGYDPLFLPRDISGKTMAELLPHEKNALSHRFHALQDLAAKLSGKNTGF